MIKTLNSVYFIRHGETDYNKADLFTGSTDVTLNNVGRMQAQEAAKKLRSLHIEEIWTSPLIRAKETAEIISANLNLPVVTFSVMAERHFGRLEGKLKNSVDRKALPDDAENEVDFHQRAKEVLSLICKRNRNILIVSHSGIFKEISKALNNSVEAEVKIDNCEIVKIY